MLRCICSYELSPKVFFSSLFAVGKTQDRLNMQRKNLTINIDLNALNKNCSVLRVQRPQNLLFVISVTIFPEGEESYSQLV